MLRASGFTPAAIMSDANESARHAFAATLVGNVRRMRRADEVRRALETQREAPERPGLSTTLIPVDVWESKEQYEAFARDQIGPFSQQAGLTGPPEVTYYEVHSYLTPG